ncbi:hypothetical protein RFI_15593, partial [Reticulomyxa filosa]
VKTIVTGPEITNHNIFHEMGCDYRIAPTLLVRRYLSARYNLTNPQISCILSILASEDLFSMDATLSPSSSASASASSSSSSSDGNSVITSLRDNILQRLKTFQERLSENPDLKIPAAGKKKQNSNAHSHSTKQAMIDIALKEWYEIWVAVQHDFICGPRQALLWRQCENVFRKDELIHDIFPPRVLNARVFLGLVLFKVRQLLATMNDHIAESMSQSHPSRHSFVRILREQEVHDKIKHFIGHQSPGKICRTNDQIYQRLQWKQGAPFPVLIFNRAIIINGVSCHWLSPKHCLMVHHNHKYFGLKKYYSQADQLTEIFGKGAFVCLGEIGPSTKTKHKIHVFDASSWNPTTQLS